MLPYIVAAVALLIALAMVEMSLRHRTILDEAVEREMVERLNRLTPDSKARWGRMSVAQMLRHVSIALGMAGGSLAVPSRGFSPLSFPPIRQLVIGVIPFPKGAPTAPALIVREESVFVAEHEAVRQRLASLRTSPPSQWPAHPLFGSLTRDQWGVLIWKHLDHHLRQFGV